MNRGKKKKLKAEAKLVQDAVVQAIEKALEEMQSSCDDNVNKENAQHEKTVDTEMC